MKILLVEDDTLIRSYFSLLFKAEGFDCVEAPNGTEALAILRSHEGKSISVAVVDVNMPVLSGPGFVKALEKKNFVPNLKVMFFTASIDPAPVFFRGKIVRSFEKFNQIQELLSYLRSTSISQTSE